jgi:hypothetical protein
MSAKTYQVIGKPEHVAMTDCRGSLSTAKRIFKPSTFFNGLPALIVAESFRKRDAELWRIRCESALAYQSGRLGRWITPSFVVIKANGGQPD